MENLNSFGKIDYIEWIQLFNKSTKMYGEKMEENPYGTWPRLSENDLSWREKSARVGNTSKTRALKRHERLSFRQFRNLLEQYSFSKSSCRKKSLDIDAFFRHITFRPCYSLACVRLVLLRELLLACLRFHCRVSSVQMTLSQSESFLLTISYLSETVQNKLNFFSQWLFIILQLSSSLSQYESILRSFEFVIGLASRY